MVIVKAFTINCPTNKVKYANMRHALTSLKNLRNRGYTVKRTYNCPICHFIHLTSR